MVVIDPAFFSDRILEALDGRHVAAIVLTHRHFDHIGAVCDVAAATGAPVLCHEADADAVCDPSGNLSDWMGVPLALPPVDRRLVHGDRIEAGTLVLTVLHTPGHTQGSICLLGPGHLFSGDTMFASGFGRTDLPTGSMDDLRRSFADVLDALPDDTTVHPGHGEETIVARERSLNPLMPRRD